MRTFDLPVIHPYPELDYHAFCQCADENYGNFYDFIPQDASRLAISFGDLPAASEAAAVSIPCLDALVRGLTAGTRGDAAELASELNRTLYLLGPRDLCAPWFFALADPLRHELLYVNAGHEPPLLIRRNGRVERLERTGAALGLSVRDAPQQRTVSIDPGDILAIFSEAVEESLVLEVIRENRHASATELALRVWDRTGRPSVEDRTFAAVRVLGACREPLRHEFAVEEALCAA